MELFDLLLSREVLLIMAGVIAVVVTVQRIVPELRQSALWRRVLPAVPLALAVGAALVWNVFDGVPVVERVLQGLWAGMLAAQGRKLVLQGVLGRFKADPAPADPLAGDAADEGEA